MHQALEAGDDEFSKSGRVGMWTKSDAVTHFDNLVLGAADAKDVENL